MVTRFCKDLEKQHIRYAFIDNKIDNLDYCLYFGIDSYKNGQLGAWLLTNRTEPTGIALVRIHRDQRHKSDPNRTRRHGFTDYIEEHFPECQIHTIFIDPDNPDETMGKVEEFFRENPSVHHIAMTNSRVFLLEDYIRKHPDEKRIVVGFDDIKKNLDCLREGLIDILSSVTSRNKHTNHFVHMEILTQMNLDN